MYFREKGDVLMVVDNAQLRALAKLVLNQHELLAETIESEPKRVKFIKICTDAHDITTSLLDKAEALRAKYVVEGGGVDDDHRAYWKAEFVKDVLAYVNYGVNMSLLSTRNCFFRFDFIDNTDAHFDYLARELKDLDDPEVDDETFDEYIRFIAETVSTSTDTMLRDSSNIMHFPRNYPDVLMVEDNNQLRKLAKIQSDQEELLAQTIQSESESKSESESDLERTEFLKDSKDAYDNVISLLDKVEVLCNKYEGDQAKAKANIAKDIVDFAKQGANTSMQSIRDCGSRGKHIDKIMGQFDSLAKELEEWNPEDETEVERLAKAASTYKPEGLAYPSPFYTYATVKDLDHCRYNDYLEYFEDDQEVSLRTQEPSPTNINIDDLAAILNTDQLSRLARLLYNNEWRLMANIRSEPERVIYLRECHDAYTGAIALIDEADALANKYNNSGAKSDIAQDLADYLIAGINMSLQNVQNCPLRNTCIEKIRDHYEVIVDELDKIDLGNLPDLLQLAEDVKTYKEYMWEYAYNSRSRSARVRSRAYSDWIKSQGIEFNYLVNREMSKLGYTGEFENLSDSRKLEVYNSIIGDSRRSTKLTKFLGKAEAAASFAFTAGMLVWDIYHAEYRLEFILRTALDALVDYGAFKVQVLVTGAVTTALVKLKLGVVMVATAGFVAGAVVGLLFTAVAGRLLDRIFSSGGRVVPDMESLRFHCAIMPSGMALANQITHHSKMLELAA